MADAKYGRLFTEEDVLLLMARYGEYVSGRAVASVNRALGGAEPRPSVGDLERELGRVVEEFDGDFPADEPLFLLRGEWVAVAGVVGTFADFARSLGWPGVEERVRAEAHEIARWQSEHPDRVKAPD